MIKFKDVLNKVYLLPKNRQVLVFFLAGPCAILLFTFFAAILVDKSFIYSSPMVLCCLFSFLKDAKKYILTSILLTVLLFPVFHLHFVQGNSPLIMFFFFFSILLSALTVFGYTRGMDIIDKLSTTQMSAKDNKTKNAILHNVAMHNLLEKSTMAMKEQIDFFTEENASLKNFITDNSNNLKSIEKSREIVVKSDKKRCANYESTLEEIIQMMIKEKMEEEQFAKNDARVSQEIIDELLKYSNKLKQSSFQKN